MNELVRMLMVFGVTIILMILSVNLSTYASESKFMKEDLEVAVHDASLQVDSEALSNGFIIFDQEKAKDTFKETLEINTGMVEGDDYSIVEWQFFDHHTQPTGFACENIGAAPYEFNSSNVDASFTITCPTLLAVIQHKTKNFIYLAGDSREGKDIVKGAAYSYEYDPEIFGVEGASMASFSMLGTQNVSTFLNNINLIKDGNYYWPVPYTKNITSHFQKNRINPVTGELKDHNGTDIAAPGVENKPVVSIADGKVSYAGKVGGYGYVVEIVHDDGLVTRYAHLNSILTIKGSKVSGGDPIGLIGSTGNSTGPHLHFEAMLHGTFINPMTLY